MAQPPTKEWKTGLCDCFEDCSTCCYGFWCCPCLACTVSGRFNENQCLPLCDILSPAAFAACGIPLFIPPAGLSLRASIRNRHGIKGSLCKDMLVSCFCVWCSWCQMHRELKGQGQGQAQAPVIMMMPQTQQPTTVINVQANPVMSVNQNSAPPPGGVQSPTGYQNPAQSPPWFQNPAQGPFGYQNPPESPVGFQNPVQNPPAYKP